MFAPQNTKYAKRTTQGFRHQQLVHCMSQRGGTTVPILSSIQHKDKMKTQIQTSQQPCGCHRNHDSDDSDCGADSTSNNKQGERTCELFVGGP